MSVDTFSKRMNSSCRASPTFGCTEIVPDAGTLIPNAMRLPKRFSGLSGLPGFGFYVCLLCLSGEQGISTQSLRLGFVVACAKAPCPPAGCVLFACDSATSRRLFLLLSSCVISFYLLLLCGSCFVSLFRRSLQHILNLRGRNVQGH